MSYRLTRLQSEADGSFLLSERGAHVDLVVGYNEHAASWAALSFAAALAVRLNACLHIVHVVDLEDYPVDPDAADWEEECQTQLEAEREQVRFALKGVDRPLWSYTAVRGEPVRSLLDAAERHEALMLVVGTPEHGLSATVDHLVAGSIARGLLRRSGRPVVVVPKSEERSSYDDCH